MFHTASVLVQATDRVKILHPTEKAVATIVIEGDLDQIILSFPFGSDETLDALIASLMVAYERIKPKLPPKQMEGQSDIFEALDAEADEAMREHQEPNGSETYNPAPRP